MKPFSDGRPALLASLAAILATMPPAQAQAQAQDDEVMEEIVITGSLRSLPGEEVEIFGFGKSLLATPRSASTISFEQMERFNITDIDELVAFAPGTFTQSFFGVAGALDVRGTPGEVYFRGVRRLDNPGNYPTPIGASDRIDIVRGPASPIMGPAKIGGYLNFNPKSARAESGEYLDSTTGVIAYETGRWDRQVVTAEVGGPLAQRMGYYLYGEFEDSGSFYDNTATEQRIVQASFDVDLSDQLLMQFGGMYHDYTGNQIAGWNRLTQDLIDRGAYITGTAQALDFNGDGRISHQEYCGNPCAGDPRFSALNPFRFAGPATIRREDVPPELALVNPGLGTLNESSVLVDPDDRLDNVANTLYLDVIYTADSGLKIKNQLFYEGYDNINENAYGFSQQHDSWVIENKLVLAYRIETEHLVSSLQLSPSLRYTNFQHGTDYINEYFDRRDLSIPAAQRNASLDARVLATTIGRDYTEYYSGDYLNGALALLGDFSWDQGLSVTLGLRQDWIEAQSRTDPNRLLGGVGLVGDVLAIEDREALLSWSFSASWDSPLGWTPYVTLSEQATVIAGQGAELSTGNIASGGWTDVSKLREIGIKGSFLDDSLYVAVAVYEQERTDFSAQATVTNTADLTQGSEVELRWAVNDKLLVTGGWTQVTVENLNAQQGEGAPFPNARFSFFGAEDFPLIDDPSILYGGYYSGNIRSPLNSRRAGVPENIYTLTATYAFDKGWAIFGSVVDVEETISGFSARVKLPAYTLLNAGVSYETANWTFQLNGKNITNERYFRANFPNLFGGQIVLPELPWNWQARVTYRF